MDDLSAVIRDGEAIFLEQELVLTQFAAFSHKAPNFLVNQFGLVHLKQAMDQAYGSPFRSRGFVYSGFRKRKRIASVIQLVKM